MAAPDPFLTIPPSPEFFGAGDWKELVASLDPSADNSFSRTSAEASLVGVIDELKVRGCLRYCLGYDAVGKVGYESPIRLHRTNPVPHPRYPNLFCTSAAELGIAPNPVLNQSSVYSLKVPGNPTQFSPINVLGQYGVGNQGARTKYRNSRITLRFEPLPFQMADDSTISTPSDEYKRNTFIDQEPRAEELTLQGFQMTYAEGTGLPAVGYSNPAGPPPANFPSLIGQIVVKSDLRVVWDWVPEDWIMYPGTKTPTRILWRLGCVNNDVFLGYDIGTLALMGVKLTRYPWPLYQPASDTGDPMVTPTLPAESLYVYRIEFLMSYFNPKKGFTGNPPMRLISANGFDTQGHNCFPWRGILTGGDVQAGLWFYSTYDGTEDGTSLFRYTTFPNMFDAASNGEPSGR